MELQGLGPASSDIYDACSKCSVLFAEYIKEPSTHNKDEVEELQSRFNLWAAYTGAFAAAGASLDDRLRFHDEIKLMVLKLLSMLQRNLQSAIARRQGSHTVTTKEETASGLPEEKLMTADSYHGLQAVSAALDRLHRLATAIRRSSVNRSEKLSTSMMPSEEDVSFEACIFQFIQGRFCAARPGLVKQLTAALCYHRKRLLYQSRHNKKLAHMRQKDDRIKQDQPLQPPLPLSKGPQLPAPAVTGAVAAKRIASSVAFSKTNASVPSILRLNRTLAEPHKSTPSIASTGTVSIPGETFYYPDPPIPGDRKYLPCPYCAETLEASKLDMKERSNVQFWRTHLNEDLKPYFCIAEECRDPLRFFVDFEDWLNHMTNCHSPDWPMSIHGAVWMCYMCSGQPPQFNEVAEFNLHMSSTHGILTKTQRIARTKRAKKRALRERWMCPLCDCVPSKLAKISLQDQDREARSLLERHIGSHIKALSLLSFRFHLSEDDKNDFSAASTDDNVSVEALLPDADQQVSQKASHSTLSDRSAQGDIVQETANITPGSEHSTTGDDEDLEPPHLLGSGAWDFMPDFEHLQDQDPDVQPAEGRVTSSYIPEHKEDYYYGQEPESSQRFTDTFGNFAPTNGRVPIDEELLELQGTSILPVRASNPSASPVPPGRPDIPAEETDPTGKGKAAARLPTRTRVPSKSLSVDQLKTWAELTRNQSKFRGKKHKLLYEDELIHQLKSRDHIFVIDDGETMFPHWGQLLSLYQNLIYMVKKKHLDPNGSELQFIISDQRKEARHTSELVQMVAGMKYQVKGESNLAARLNNIFTEYRNKLTKKSSARPVSIYVFTDGYWQGGKHEEVVGHAIEKMVRFLEKENYPDNMVGIQFIRFGNDPEGVERLRWLDEDLPKVMSPPKRDICDTTPANGNVWKMLLGSINDFWDDYPDT
ncbi:hypothetical protein A1O1_01872 [Capronia coronata CBS 617.96]|uniref:VWFA domain-containing protein n=1 Tax=Capronia coronata CBS 617.96 TaxID=1182541 RepID=W9YUY5_9EURO|nr:uncharacterized protein A1O1_01872 [Capronia coronata CBS 617.96]EXJ93480.1 hypothetical protein A1O1_01872 [Capronia coronata CBS 617.96]